MMYSSDAMQSSPLSQPSMSQTPSPLSMTQPGAQSPVTPSYASGGSTMRLVHMSPHELREMDEMQGGPKFNRSNGVKEYDKFAKKFGHILHHPHFKMMMHAERAHHAHGGLSGHLQHMAAQGRHGDTRLAYIPHHLVDLFDEISGHHPRNPHTGHPEYFSLGGLFSGLKGVGSSLGKGLGSIGGSAKNLIGKGFSAAGNAAKQLPGLARKAGTAVLGAAPEGGWVKNIGQGLISGLGNAAATKLSGGSWGDALKQGALAGSSGFNSPAAQALQQGLTTSLEGGNLKNSLLSGLSRGSGNFDNALGRGLNNAANMGLQGKGLKDVALGGLSGATAGMQHPLARGLHAGSNAALSGSNLTDSLLQGGLGALTGGAEEPQPEMTHLATGGYANGGYADGGYAEGGADYY